MFSMKGELFMRKKWEDIYNKYQNGEMDVRLEELKNKVSEKTANQEEYKEIRRIEKIKSNLKMINNIRELQNKLDEEADRLEEEIIKGNDGKTIAKLDKELEKLEEELNKLNAEKEKIQEKIKASKDEEEKEKLESKLKDIDKKIEQNNSKYSENRKDREELVKDNENKDDKMSLKDKKNKWNMIKNKSVKCELAMINLLNGRDWDCIEKKLDEYKDIKFTSKQKVTNVAKNIKDARNKERTSETSERTSRSEERTSGTRVRTEVSEERKSEVEERAMTVKSEFDEKHPILSKIKNWCVNFYKKYIDVKYEPYDDYKKRKEQELQGQKTEQTEKTKEITKKNDDRIIEDIIKSKDNQFKKYLKDYAEKGKEQLAEENRNEKIKKMKEQAYARESAKFGKDYAEKSYHKEEETR